MNTKNVQANMGIKGMVTVRRYKAGTVQKAREIIAFFGKDSQVAKNLLSILFEKNFIAIGAQHHNLVMSSADHGRNLIVQHLIGTDTHPLQITYGEIGVGATAPTASDTELDSASYRKAVEVYDSSNNVCSMQFFWADAELANGTYTEFGTFTEGSSTIGTGYLFNRALFSPVYTKASGEDTTIEVEFTISS